MVGHGSTVVTCTDRPLAIDGALNFPVDEDLDHIVRGLAAIIVPAHRFLQVQGHRHRPRPPRRAGRLDQARERHRDIFYRKLPPPTGRARAWASIPAAAPTNIAARRSEKGPGTPHLCLIRSTANQVDQFGNYIGMTPEQFYAYVLGLARELDVPSSQVILGGDHLGPLTFAEKPEAEAMASPVNSSAGTSSPALPRYISTPV